MPSAWAFMFLLALSMTVNTAHASEGLDLQNMPLWELGVGGGGIWTPDYPGSDHTKIWAVPFPYAVYRGDILHSDRRGGTRARILRSAHYEFNLSAAGGLPSSASPGGAREGMPDLEWLGECGPRLMFDLLSYADGRLLRLGLPVRAAFSSNGKHLTDRGFLFAPELLYDHPNLFGSKWDGFLLFTINFAERRFNNYFYGVQPDYATPERPAYTARPGYLLSDLSFGVVAPIESARLRIILAGSVQSLDGSANQSSPLFRTPVNASVSLVLVWIFAKSEVMVSTED